MGRRSVGVGGREVGRCILGLPSTALPLLPEQWGFSLLLLCDTTKLCWILFCNCLRISNLPMVRHFLESTYCVWKTHITDPFPVSGKVQSCPHFFRDRHRLVLLSPGSSRTLPCDLNGPAGLNSLEATVSHLIFQPELLLFLNDCFLRGFASSDKSSLASAPCHLAQIRSPAMSHVELFSFGLMDYQIVFWMALSQRACWKRLSL